MKVIIIAGLLVAGSISAAWSYTCRTDCYRDALGNVHCTERCSKF